MKRGEKLKKLELQFENEEGTTTTISLDQPVEPVSVVSVNEVMDMIIAEDVFSSTKGNLTAKKAARLVERKVVDIDLGM